MLERQEFIYFIQEGTSGFIKIGITTDIESRIKALQTGNPRKLRCIANFRGSHIYEQKLHIKFNSSRYNGEWFHPTKDLLQYIGRIKNEVVQNVIEDTCVSERAHFDEGGGGTDEYLSLVGLSDYSKMGISTLRSHIKEGGLPWYKAESRMLVRRSEFDSWMKQFRRCKC